MQLRLQRPALGACTRSKLSIHQQDALIEKRSVLLTASGHVDGLQALFEVYCPKALPRDRPPLRVAEVNTALDALVEASDAASKVRAAPRRAAPRRVACRLRRCAYSS